MKSLQASLLKSDYIYGSPCIIIITNLIYQLIIFNFLFKGRKNLGSESIKSLFTEEEMFRCHYCEYRAILRYKLKDHVYKAHGIIMRKKERKNICGNEKKKRKRQREEEQARLNREREENRQRANNQEMDKTQRRGENQEMDTTQRRANNQERDKTQRRAENQEMDTTQRRGEKQGRSRTRRRTKKTNPDSGMEYNGEGFGYEFNAFWY